MPTDGLDFITLRYRWVLAGSSALTAGRAELVGARVSLQLWADGADEACLDDVQRQLQRADRLVAEGLDHLRRAVRDSGAA